MMKTKLLFWLAFFSIGMQAQNINFPDANFKTLLLSSSSSNTIAKNLSGNYFAIDADGNGEVSLIEAQAVSEIKLLPKMISFGGYEEPDFNELDRIMNYEGINDFVNVTSVTLHRIAVPLNDLTISGLNSIKSFSSIFYNSDSGNLTINNCPSLTDLTVSGISFSSPSIISQTKSLSLSFPSISQNNLLNILPYIENATFLEDLQLTSNWNFSNDGSLNLNLDNHQNIKKVTIRNIGFSDLILSSCPQLNSVSISNNYSQFLPIVFGNLNVSNCPLISELILDSSSDNYSNISNLNADNCLNLTKIKTDSDFLNNLSINNCPVLSSVTLNKSTGIQMSNVPALKEINISRFNGYSFDATPATNLENLYLDYKAFSMNPYVNHFGELKELIVKNNSALKELTVNNQKLTNLDVSGLSNLEKLNSRVSYGYSGDPQPDFSIDFLLDLNAENCNSLQEVSLSGQMGLKRANFKDCASLKQFVFEPSLFSGGGILESLNFENCFSLKEIDANNNKLSYLNVKKCSSLESINVEKNRLTELDVQGFVNLESLNCSFNQLNTLNIESNLKLKIFRVSGNSQLNSLFMKNGVDSFGEFGPITPSEDIFWQTPNLKYICADETEISYLKTDSDYLGVADLSINSYCSFTPGGNFNTISGAVKIDANNNGCDSADNPFEFLKLKINDGTSSGETFVQQNGKYEFYTQAGNFNIIALAENPALFTISPANFSTNFADSNNHVFTQDICVTSNGTQNDAEVVIAPLTAARPGFDATYNLVWRNKGNTTLSGKVVLNYDHNRMVFQSSSLAYSVISNGSIEFNYSNLKPFANESTELIFTINTPTNPTNPVNSDDILPFNAQITPNMSDLTPEDNNFKFDQKVVNSFDPNDIVCMEGEIIPTVAVGKYMHYVVNFENTGTAEAENIVVKMNIDPAEFDINTLQLQNASADVSTVIAGNAVEFKFKKIKLKAGGHGHVLLKVRSLTGLQEGDTVNNKADIYFDYNFPVATNDYVTTILDEHSVLNAKVNYEAAAFSSNNYTIDFDASFSTGNITSYAWEFPNAASVSSTTSIKPSVTYNVAGNYTAKLTIFDADNNTSVKTVSFKVGNTTADLSTGRDNDGNFIAIDADDDDWKGYDINGTEITPKIRTTYTGWSNADLSNGVNSRWISLNNFEGYYNYKSRAFTIPNNATDAKLNLRSLSFVRNWTYLVKINPDGSETETEITKTQWLNDGFKGWLNSRSPKVDNYALSPGTYYIKVLVYSNNSTVRESLDVNAIVTSSTGLMNANKIVPPTITLQAQGLTKQKVRIYPVPTHGELNIDSDSEILSVEVHDAVGRILEKKHFAPSKSVKLTINSGKGLYFLRIMTKQGIVNQKIIKE